MSKPNLTKYLVPRMFYFFIEPESCSEEACKELCENDTSCPTDPEKQKAHVQIAIYRVNKGQTRTDGKPRVLRSWNEHENKAFQVVYPPMKENCINLVDNKLQFKQENQEAYPTDGVEYKKFPALVLVNEWLEPDSEFVAYSRIHNGGGWGPWSRIAQTRLDFIDEQGNTIQDLPMFNPRPQITAVVDKRILSRGTNPKLKVLTIEDDIPLDSVYINGMDVTKNLKREEIGSNKEEKEKIQAGKYLYKLANKPLSFTPIKDSPQIGIVAKNVLGNYSKAFKAFEPQYGSSGIKRYVVYGKEKFISQGGFETPVKFRIRCYANPCLSSFKKLVGKDDNGPYIESKITIGNQGDKYNIPLYQPDEKTKKQLGIKLKHNGVEEPYYGMNSIADPGDVAPAIKYEKKSTIDDPSKYATLDASKDSWVWISKPLVAVFGNENIDPENREPGDTFIDAQLGELIFASLPTVDDAVSPRIPSDASKGTLTSDEDFQYLLSPKNVAAGIRIVKKGSHDPITSIKNGDDVFSDIYTIEAEPLVRIKGGVSLANSGDPLEPIDNAGEITLKSADRTKPCLELDHVSNIRNDKVVKFALVSDSTDPSQWTA